MPSYKNAEEAQKAMGASIDEKKKKKKKEKLESMSKEKRQRKLNRAERKKYGGVFTSKKKKKKRALAARAKERAKEKVEEKKNKKTDEAVGYTEVEKALQEPLVLGSESSGGSMGYKAKTKLFKMMGHNVNIPQKGASMKSNQSGGGYNAKNPAAAAKQLMRNQKDGGSMYGKKHGSSMNKYDKKMMHLREQISDDKKAIHRTDQAKKSHAHPIFKHMRKF